jgi:hypothetical protein
VQADFSPVLQEKRILDGKQDSQHLAARFSVSTITNGYTLLSSAEAVVAFCWDAHD